MKNASLWEITLAVIVLILVMEFIPHGIYIGVFLLLLTMLETPAATQGIANLLNFIQNGGK